ncbi:MAG: YcxB family protein [Vulcanimicrobiaceae bacterium]
MTPVHVTIARRREDYLEAFNAVIGRRLIRSALIIFAALLVIDAARGWLGPANRLHDVIVLVIVDAAIVAIVFGLAYLTTVYLTAQRMYRAHLRITGTSYTFDDGGMQYVSSTSSSHTKWEAFAAYRETKSLFLLYYPNRLFQLIPKRNVDDGRVDDLRELLRANVRANR